MSSSRAPKDESLSLHCRFDLVDDPTAPLALMIHGRAGNRGVMWAFSRAVPAHWSILTPEADIPDPVMPHSLHGVSWWDIATRGSGLREGARTASDKLEVFRSEFFEHHRLSPRAVVLIGFSQGAALSSYLLQTKSDLFSGAALLCGFTIELESPPRLFRKEVYVAHGAQDDVVPLSLATKGVEYLRSRGATVQFHTDETGHKMGTAGIKILAEWLGKMG